jgi:hypothetical protein
MPATEGDKYDGNDERRNHRTGCNGAKPGDNLRQKNLPDPQPDKELAKLFEAGRERFEAEKCPMALHLVQKMVWGETCLIPRLRAGGPEMAQLSAEEEQRYREIAAEFGALASEEVIEETVIFARPESKTAEFGIERIIPITYIRFEPPGPSRWPEYKWPGEGDLEAAMSDAAA